MAIHIKVYLYETVRTKAAILITFQLPETLRIKAVLPIQIQYWVAIHTATDGQHIIARLTAKPGTSKVTADSDGLMIQRVDDFILLLLE